MKTVSDQFDSSEVSVGDLDTFRIWSSVEFGAYGQSSTCLCIGNKIEHDFVADQRLASPVRADKGKHAMLDFIPFARSRRKMADPNRYTDLVGESLQFQLPEPHPRPIASSAVSRYEQFRRVGISSLADTLPPPANGLHGESGRCHGQRRPRPIRHPLRYHRRHMDSLGPPPR